MAEFWTTERLQRAALEELCRHGGTASEVQALLEQFKQAVKDKSSDEDNGHQAGDIPD
jgi:hypothetical protein